MTMDIYQRAMRVDSSPPVTTDSFHQPSASAASGAKRCPKSVKRSFDVAFLMAPDDLTKRRRDGGSFEKAARYSPPVVADSFLLSALPFGADPAQPYQRSPLRLTVHSSPAAAAAADDHRMGAGSRSPPRADVAPRSAFTKVAAHSVCALESFPRTPPVARSPSSASSTASTHSGLSPDLLAYQDSLSPQPFVPSRSPVHPLPSKHHGHGHGHGHHYQPPQSQHASPFLKTGKLAFLLSLRKCIRAFGGGRNHEPIK